MGRTERLFRISSLLREGQKLRFDEMTHRLDISSATLKRDLRYLRQQLGAPIEYDASERVYHIGSPQHRQGMEVPGLWFAPEDLHALVLAYRLLGELDPQRVLAPRLKELVDRVNALATGEQTDLGWAERIEVVVPLRHKLQLHFLGKVALALAQRRRLRLRSDSLEGPLSLRDVSPQRLVFDGDWQLDAWCHESLLLQRLQLDAFSDVEPLDQQARFLPLYKLKPLASGRYGVAPGQAPCWATLVFDAACAEAVQREEWHPLQRTRRLADGRLEMVLPYARSAQLVSDILHCGESVEVVGDEGLREAVAAQVHALSRRYAT